MFKSVLHISNGYLGLSNVHQSLYSELDKKGVRQVVFAPVRKGKLPREGRNIKFQQAASKFVFSRELKLYHKFLFKKKIDFLFEDLIRQVSFQDIGALHATTLFSDGALALRIYHLHHIPYIVTVRSTDLAFIKYRPDLVSLAKKILMNASKIVFVSDAMSQELYSLKYFKALEPTYKAKSIVLNNGIDSVWLSSTYPKKDTIFPPFKILYVGRFTKPKNILRLIKSVAILNREKRNVILTIVGEKGYLKAKVVKLSNKYSEFIKYLGAIYDREQLAAVYQGHHIFAMPSYRETFGQVYIEALSQGLPVLYGKKEGIDGLLSENIGESVNPFSAKEIKRGLELMMDNFNQYNLHDVDFLKFHWDYLADQYIEIYNSIKTSTNN